MMNLLIESLQHKKRQVYKNLKNIQLNGKTNEYGLKNNIFFKIINDKEILVLPEAMQVEDMKNCHSLRHFFITKTEDVVKRDYYFPKLKKCVETVIKNCIECISVNKKSGKGEGRLNSISKEDMPLSTYHVDFF